MADIIRPIEPFELTQLFGENPALYARFGLKGHNGWDIRTKYPDTPEGKRSILASFDSAFYVQGNEGNDGYGLYFEVIVQLYNTWKLTFAHCHSIEKFKTKKESEKMAVAGNTGNSTGAHLHLTVKQGVLLNGVFTNREQNNGYFGALEPQLFFDELRNYKKEFSGISDCEKQVVQLQEDVKKAEDKAQEKDNKYEAEKDKVEKNDIAYRAFLQYINAKIMGLNPVAPKALKEEQGDLQFNTDTLLNKIKELAGGTFKDITAFSDREVVSDFLRRITEKLKNIKFPWIRRG